jgi:hypothetical protein
MKHIKTVTTAKAAEEVIIRAKPWPFSFLKPVR